MKDIWNAFVGQIWKWLTIALIVVALVLTIKSIFDGGKITKLREAVAAEKTNTDVAVAANKIQGVMIDKMIAADIEKAKFNADRQQIVEKHYVTERRIEQRSKDIQQERSNANLEDGAISPDLGLVLDRLRRDIQEGNSGRPAGDGGSSPPDPD